MPDTTAKLPTPDLARHIAALQSASHVLDHVGQAVHAMNLWSAANGVAAHRCGSAPTGADGHDIAAFVVMSERKTELAYKGVHTREAAESLAGGFDDVEVRGAEDVIRELCEQVARLEAAASATSSPQESVGGLPHYEPNHGDRPVDRGADALGAAVSAFTLRPGFVRSGSLCRQLAQVVLDAASHAANDESGEPYLHTLRCVKDACTEDCPRRHESGGLLTLPPEPPEGTTVRIEGGNSDGQEWTRSDEGEADGRRWGIRSGNSSEGWVRWTSLWWRLTEDDGAAQVGIRVLPRAPLAVGDTVETEAELASLPIGAVLRDATNDLAWLDDENTWRVAGIPGMGGTALVDLPARLLDLPATVGSS